jgi:hypothetical protein
MRRAAHLALVVVTFLALAPAADAAVRKKLDRDNEVRFELHGMQLSMAIVDRERFTQSPTIESELLGQKVRVGCATSFRASRASVVMEVLRWPADSRSASVRLARDISRRAKWCLIEMTGRYVGGDIAFVSFHQAEPGRRLTSGRLRDGTRWRLAAWRGNMLQPCLALRLPNDEGTFCFDDEAEAGIEASSYVPTCSGETFVLGATSRAATRVEIRLADGATAPAVLRPRPRASRVRAQYFTALIDGPVEVSAVIAYDAQGRAIARDRGINGMASVDCDAPTR